ncbi:DUF1348 family protein [Pseudomonas cichorii]|uniref:DUF1348 family protein n=1 Tax=Pseudomonas cichorii TaxID=36746 RepID=UPI0035A6276E
MRSARKIYDCCAAGRGQARSYICLLRDSAAPRCRAISYGNENREFEENRLTTRRFACINDLPIKEPDRKFHWPTGRRPDDHPGLSELGGVIALIANEFATGLRQNSKKDCSLAQLSGATERFNAQTDRRPAYARPDANCLSWQ